MRVASLALLCLAAQAAAAGVDLEALVANSPFGASPSSGSAAPAAPAPNLELRGMYRENGRTYYSVYNTTTKQGVWVAEGDKPADAAAPAVKSFDEATSTLVVEIAGKPASLTLKAATVSKYEPPPQPRAEEAGPRGGPPLPEPGPDGKVQTPWGSFTPEQIAAYRAERERRWQERMQQMQSEGGGEGGGRRSRSEEGGGEAGATGEGGGRRRGPR